MLKKVFHIIPVTYKKKAVKHLGLSVFNVFLDLLSIAYIIPLFIFILDESKIPSFIKTLMVFNNEDITWWILGIVLLFVLKNLIQTWIIKAQSKLVFAIATTLSSKLASNYLKEPYSVIQNMDKGKALQKIQMSGTDFSNFILLSLNTLFTEFLVVLALAVISLFLNATLTAYVMLFGMVCFCLLYLFKHRKINAVSNSIKTSYAATASHLLNILNGSTEIKSLQKEDYFVKKFQKKLRKFNNNLVILKTLQNSNIKYLEIFLILGLSLFVLFLNNQQDIPTNRVVLISYLAAVSLKLFPSLNKIILAYTNFKSYKYTIEVFSNLKTNEQKNEYRTFNKDLVLKNIHFGYDKENILLKDIHLTINKGDVIGIKGRSGCGKTTLLNLIMGLLQPDSGSLLLDGKAIEKNWSLFPFTTYVPQQSFIFHGSILENITLGEDRKTIDFYKIEFLLKSVMLWELINKLPQQLHTVLSHDSLMLSGGQKQRLTLVRALYSSPQVLILDEATNQLDEALEKIVLTFLKDYAKANKTTILLVSHTALPQENVKMYKLTDGNLDRLMNT